MYTACRTAKRKVPAIRRAIRFSENVMKDIVTGSIETLVLEHCDNLKVVEADIYGKISIMYVILKCTIVMISLTI